MPEPGTKIETGVDKLVKLVAAEKKISLEDAAKELGVPIALVQEWADFLQQEGLLDTEYSLMKSYLLEKRLSREDVARKSKEYDTKKDAFIRKVDVALGRLDTETATFEALRQKYYELKDKLGDNFGEVEAEIDELHYYDDLKKSIDKDIIEQRGEYKKAIDQIHSQLATEEDRYQSIVKEIEGEDAKLRSESTEISDLQKEETELMSRIKAMQQIISGVVDKLSTEASSIPVHQERLRNLRELAGKLEHELAEKKRKSIDPLEKISHDQEQRILRIQDEIFQKVKARRDKLQEFETESEDLETHFHEYFGKREQAEAAMKALEQMKLDMHNELVSLITKTKAFDLTAKGADTNAHIKELEVKFKEFDQKKAGFNHEMEALKRLMMGEEKVAEKIVDSPLVNTRIAKDGVKPVAKNSTANKSL